MLCAQCGKEIDQEFLSNYLGVGPQYHFCVDCFLDKIKNIMNRVPATTYTPKKWKEDRFYGKTFGVPYVDEWLICEEEEEE